MTARPHPSVVLPGGVVTGVGALPHRSAADAARCSLRRMELPVVPAVPRRSPAESAVARAIVGMQGVTLGHYGSISVDVGSLDPLAPIVTDLGHDAFLGVRRFLAMAPTLRPDLASLTWTTIGPVTLGVALLRAGVPAGQAFECAVRAVRARVQHLLDAIRVALPTATQVVFVEEPALADVTSPGFPVAPDVAVDLVSGALAAVEQTAIAGLHVCGVADIGTQLATGPAIVSVPVHPGVVDAAGYLVRHMEAGGHVAWGAVPTTGPLSGSTDRAWRDLSELWCELVRRGADPALLRRQALITPDCGLATHSPGVAERVLSIAADIGARVRDQAVASRWFLGA